MIKSISILFNFPPKKFELKTGEIHIWCASLDQPVPITQTLSQTLSSDEINRAERFYFEKDKKRFVTCRGILRAILSGYLSVGADRVQFCYGQKGKPELADTFGKETICFNLSHSRELALYGFTQGIEIGVDIEYVQDISEMDQIAKQFFSARENAILRSLPQKMKKQAFFNYWTRKEAFIKAIGNGLSMPLDKFDIELMPGEPTILLSIEGNPRSASRWCIQDIKTVPGFAAAFAVKRYNWYLSCWQWQG